MTRKVVAKWLKGRTILLAEWQEDESYWTLRLDDGTELDVQMMADVIASEDEAAGG